MQHQYISTKDVERLKQKARDLKRSTGIPHNVALDEIAKQFGFHHWHHVTQSNEPFKLAENAFSKGYILAFDVKDASEIEADDLLIEDELLRHVVKHPLFVIYSNSIYENDSDIESTKTRKEVYSPEKLKEYFYDYINDYTFFRLNESLWSESLITLPKFLRNYSFWMPEIMWVKGKLINLYNLPAEDEDGNIVGIRF